VRHPQFLAAIRVEHANAFGHVRVVAAGVGLWNAAGPHAFATVFGTVDAVRAVVALATPTVGALTTVLRAAHAGLSQLADFVGTHTLTAVLRAIEAVVRTVARLVSTDGTCSAVFRAAAAIVTAVALAVAAAIPAGKFNQTIHAMRHPAVFATFFVVLADTRGRSLVLATRTLVDFTARSLA